MEEINTNIMDKYYRMLSQIVTALKKRGWEIKTCIELKNENQVNIVQIINVARFGEHQITLSTWKPDKSSISDIPPSLKE